MISAFRRDGLVLSSSAVRYHSNTVKFAHQRLALRQHALLSNGQRVHLAGTARQFSWTSQRPASLPDQQKSRSQDTAPLPIPPTKKHKVELKPAPVKPNELEKSTSPNHADSAVSQSTSTPSSSTPHTDTTSGVIETAKHDYDDASQHGILAPAPQGSSRIYTLFHHAKELFKFYMRGLKLIFTNRRRANEMAERVRVGGPPLTRWETRFIQTCKVDLLKLIPFAMIILVLEEIIPLVVLYAPFILPSTCILPTQKDRIDLKKREKQRLFVSSYPEVFAKLAEEASSEVGVDITLSGVNLKPMSGMLGLSTFTPRLFQLSALKRHLATIGEDDVLLLREQNGAHLTPSELRQALAERGILTDELPENLWRSRLTWWLNSVEKLTRDADADAASVRVKLVARSALGKF